MVISVKYLFRLCSLIPCRTSSVVIPSLDPKFWSKRNETSEKKKMMWDDTSLPDPLNRILIQIICSCPRKQKDHLWFIKQRIKCLRLP